ncbi:DUF7109 family protein [Halorarius litoreus]|uniref:DUF7109 family protein n=1 Tax=Halorarius litoreus TaxID=2962676 RepID=UPI0020CD9F98|nr:hypothetical protein [Halorarius litoreus]
MNLTPDDIAGIVDLFGALTRSELDSALDELAYRQDADVPDGAVDEALDAYAVVAFDRDDGSYLAVGPAAFPTLPEGAVDLPHILDVDPRAPDRAALANAVESRFRGDVARAVAADDDAEIRRLLDVSYDLEAWGPVELGELRTRLDDALAADREGAN